MTPEHPTVLRRPNDDPIFRHVEEILPGNPADYSIWQVGEVWTVIHGLAKEVVYEGPGPVEVIRSPAPF